MRVGHLAFSMRVAAMGAESGTDRSSLQATGAKHKSYHLMAPALVIDNVARAEFCEAKEPRPVNSFRLVSDLQERSHGKSGGSCSLA